MRDGQKIALVSGAFVIAVAGVGLGAFSVMVPVASEEPAGPGTAAGSADAQSSGPEETAGTEAPLAEAEVARVSAGFLDAWAAGEMQTAAALTDAPRQARAALTGFAQDASVAGMSLAAGTPTGPSGATVPFTLQASIAHEELAPADLGWESELTVVRDPRTGEAVIAWQPSVLHPRLAEGQSIRTGAAGEAPPVEILDATGAALTAEEHPTLAGVLADLGERYAEESGSTPEVSVRIVDARGSTVEELAQLAEAEAGQVPTTLDPALQQAAEQAVAGSERAAVVAVQPSTGAILAIANQPADGFDTALQGSYAPGSTFKIVTASMLIQKGLASSGAPHPCPKFFEHGGWRFQNLDKFEIEGGTFADSFAASCNTAFISQAPELKDSDLGTHAREVFGLGLTWQVGVTTRDGSVPTQSDAQMAAALIGQGAVRMNPLNMASVSATVKAGAFRQPYLVPPEFDGRQPAQTSGGLSAGAAAELRALMNRTAVSGTAAEAMAGLGGDIGGKTGSAEVTGQEKPNAWFTGYRNDVAAAAVVPASGHGGTFAGPIVADVLRAAP